MPLFMCKAAGIDPTLDFSSVLIDSIWIRWGTAANLYSVVERKFCLMLVDRLLRMLDTVMRHARFLRVC
jgi:hypothetical protein